MIMSILDFLLAAAVPNAVSIMLVALLLVDYWFMRREVERLEAVNETLMLRDLAFCAALNRTPHADAADFTLAADERDEV